MVYLSTHSHYMDQHLSGSHFELICDLENIFPNPVGPLFLQTKSFTGLLLKGCFMLNSLLLNCSHSYRISSRFYKTDDIS